MTAAESGKIAALMDCRKDSLWEGKNSSSLPNEI